MNRQRLLWAVVIGVVGALQAWDSGVLRAGSTVMFLVAAGIAAPTCAFLLTDAHGIRMASIGVMLVLLTWARMISPISLNGLHITVLPAAVVALVSGLQAARRSQPSSSSSC